MNTLPAIALFTLITITAVGARAQEVAYVDLTNVVQRTELRVPPPPEGTNGGSVASGVGDCGVGARDPRALRTTLTWLNALSYRTGDPIVFEAKVENVGTVPMSLQVFPHLSDLQPDDATLQFAYTQMGIAVGLRNSGIPLTHIMTYGDEEHPGTLALLRPGGWIRVRGSGVVNDLQLSQRPSGNDPTLESAYARIWLQQAKFIPHPGGYSSDSSGVCPRAEDGPEMSVTIGEGSRKIPK